MSISAQPAHRDQSFEELRIANYIKAYMTTGLPPAPVPQEPADPTARASLELPLLFQPHVDLEKTSGGGAPTDQAVSTSQVNGLSQSQDSEAAGFEAITTDEPFRGYSFEELRCLAYTNNVAYLPQIHFGVYATDGINVLQTITASPEHTDMSVEELRLAHLRQSHPATTV